jgi:hypothetical protein
VVSPSLNEAEVGKAVRTIVPVRAHSNFPCPSLLVEIAGAFHSIHPTNRIPDVSWKQGAAVLAEEHLQYDSLTGNIVPTNGNWGGKNWSGGLTPGQRALDSVSVRPLSSGSELVRFALAFNLAAVFMYLVAAI